MPQNRLLGENRQVYLCGCQIGAIFGQAYSENRISNEVRLPSDCIEPGAHQYERLPLHRDTRLFRCRLSESIQYPFLREMPFIVRQGDVLPGYFNVKVPQLPLHVFRLDHFLTGFCLCFVDPGRWSYEIIRKFFCCQDGEARKGKDHYNHQNDTCIMDPSVHLKPPFLG